MTQSGYYLAAVSSPNGEPRPMAAKGGLTAAALLLAAWALLRHDGGDRHG